MIPRTRMRGGDGSLRLSMPQDRRCRPFRLTLSRRIDQVSDERRQP